MITPVVLWPFGEVRLEEHVCEMLCEVSENEV